MRVLVELPPGNLGTVPATNDLSGVPQLLARLPQPTVLAGQTHRVGPQRAHFRQAGA